jgi:hypothetical protein
MKKKKKRTVFISAEIQTEIGTKYLKDKKRWEDWLEEAMLAEVKDCRERDTSRSLTKAERLMDGESKICGAIKVNVVD